MSASEDDLYDQHPLRRLLMQRLQQGRQPVFVANDPGISGRDTRPSDVIGQGGRKVEILPAPSPDRDPLSKIQPIPNAPYDPNPLSKIQPIPNADPNEPLRIQLLSRVAQRGNPISSMGGQGAPLGQVLTPTNRAAITRPRTVRDVLIQRTQQPTPQNPIPQAVAQADALPQQPDVPFPDANAVRQRRTQPRDYIADDEAYLRDLEKNKGSFWKRLAAAAIRGTQAATHQEISPILTSREQEIADTQNRLGRELTVAQKRQQIESGQMVPFQLPDGTWTQAPLKQVASIGSRQQGQQATLSIRRQQMEAHNKRWDTMGKHEAAQDAQRLYNSGAADDNEDLRDEIAARMGLPEGTHLPPHTQGQIRVDEKGNYVLVNPRSGAATPVTQGEAPTGSYQKTTEAGRNRRAAESQTQQNYRAGLRGQGTAKAPTVDKIAQRRAAVLVGQIEATRKKLEAFDSRNLGERTPEIERRRKAIADESAGAQAELNSLNAGYEAGMGTGGYPYYKQKEGGQQAPTGDGKRHYSMAQIQSTIDPKTGLTPNGKRLEQVLNELRSHPNVVIDQ